MTPARLSAWSISVILGAAAWGVVIFVGMLFCSFVHAMFR